MIYICYTSPAVWLVSMRADNLQIEKITCTCIVKRKVTKKLRINSNEACNNKCEGGYTCRLLSYQEHVLLATVSNHCWQIKTVLTI